MQEQDTILNEHSDADKTAYLCAIASLATADRQASPEELNYLDALSNAAGLPAEGRQMVYKAAQNEEGSDLTANLDQLKNSDLKFSLIADLISFAKADNNYSEPEQQSVQHIADHLGINATQYNALNQFADKAATAPVNSNEEQHANYLTGSGLGDKLQSAGINSGSLLKGLLTIVAPLILSKLMNRRSNNNNNIGSINSNGVSGGGLSGGLGSIIGMLNGNGSFGNAAGMLGRIFGSKY